MRGKVANINSRSSFDRISGLTKWLPLLMGAAGGFAMLYLGKGTALKDELYFGEGLFREMQYLEYQKTAYLIYLLKMRGAQMIIVVLFALVHKKKEGLYLWAVMTGCGFAIGITALLQKLGTLGAAGYFLLIFPHYLCYFYAYAKTQNIDQISQQTNRRKNGVGNKGVDKIVLLGVVIIGILLECYVNPFFIKLFIKIFF
jgi:hypothetical protein